MQGIYTYNPETNYVPRDTYNPETNYVPRDTYNPETNYVPREYGVPAILLLLFMVLIPLVSVLNLLYIYISTFRSMCAVTNMAAFCSSLTSGFPGMLLMYFIIIIIIIGGYSSSSSRRSSSSKQ